MAVIIGILNNGQITTASIADGSVTSEVRHGRSYNK